VDFNTASKYANFGEGDGSLLARRSRPDRSTPKAADPLTMRAAFVVVTSSAAEPPQEHHGSALP
jgi:hypothetical protein